MKSICFFFSSRRRHTMSKRDWSSDVCSSDLRRAGRGRDVLREQQTVDAGVEAEDVAGQPHEADEGGQTGAQLGDPADREYGRACGMEPYGPAEEDDRE